MRRIGTDQGENQRIDWRVKIAANNQRSNLMPTTWRGVGHRKRRLLYANEVNKLVEAIRLLGGCLGP